MRASLSVRWWDLGARMSKLLSEVFAPFSLVWILEEVCGPITWRSSRAWFLL